MIETPTGFILIDKPKDWTSFDVIAKLRSLTKIKKIGHAGTLDPIATGLLLVAVGRQATRQLSDYVKMDKVYLAKIKLGETSDTYDATGKIEKQEIIDISIENVEQAIKKFIGNVKQIPPMFSAKKIKGKKLYELARQGKTVERQPIEIKINNIRLLNFSFPYLELEISCGSGTYIRSLAADLGEVLGVGAVMYELRRTQIGNFSIKQATRLEQLDKNNWVDFLINKL